MLGLMVLLMLLLRLRVERQLSTVRQLGCKLVLLVLVLVRVVVLMKVVAVLRDGGGLGRLPEEPRFTVVASGRGPGGNEHGLILRHEGCVRRPARWPVGGRGQEHQARVRDGPGGKQVRRRVLVAGAASAGPDADHARRQRLQATGERGVRGSWVRRKLAVVLRWKCERRRDKAVV